MNQPSTTTASCAVCGVQTNYHASWFLVAENRWLDRLKILSWHPTLADQAEIQSVCGEEHLKVLILHWLTQANLDLHHGNDTSLAFPVGDPEDSERASAGRLLGELAVHRNPRSRNWSGSLQMFESIVNAITGGEAKARAADYSLASFHAEPGEELACAHAAGCA